MHQRRAVSTPACHHVSPCEAYTKISTLLIASMRLFSLLLLAPLALAHARSNSTLDTRAPRKPFNPPIPEGGLRPVTGTLHERSPTTNAARLAHGLSPLRPRALLAPSRAQNAPRADPSASAVAGYVQVIDAGSGDSYGYIARAYNAYGEMQMVPDVSDALHVSFTPPASAGTPFSMGATNAPASSLAFVGGVVGYSSSSDDVGSDTGAYYYLAGIPEEPVSSEPTPSDSSYYEATGEDGDLESAIWGYDSDTQALTPMWYSSGTQYVLRAAMVTDSQNYGTLVVPTNVYYFISDVTDAVVVNLVVQLDDTTSYCRCRRTSQHWERCGC